MNRFIDRSAQTRCLNLGDHSATFKAFSHGLDHKLSCDLLPGSLTLDYSKDESLATSRSEYQALQLQLRSKRSGLHRQLLPAMVCRGVPPRKERSSGHADACFGFISASDSAAAQHAMAMHCSGPSGSL